MSELINDYIKSKNPSQEELNRRMEMNKNFRKYQIISAVIAGPALLGIYFKYLTLNYFIALLVLSTFVTMYGWWNSFLTPIVKENSKTSPGINTRLKIIAIIGFISLGVMIAFFYLLNKSFS